MNNINNKDKNNNIRDKRFNDFLATNLDATINDRYCQRCHLKMVHNPRNSPYLIIFIIIYIIHLQTLV